MGWSGQTRAAMIMSFTFNCDSHPYVIPNISHAVRISGSIRSNRRLMFALICLAGAAAFLFAVWYSLYIGYTQGAQNAGGGLTSGDWVVTRFMGRLSSPETVNRGRLICFGAGFVLMALLTVLRYRFIWWPIHPVGLALLYVHPLVMAAFSVFIAWFIKLTVIKVGGITLYRKTVPLFLGLVVGYVTGVAISMVVDVIFFMGRGHAVHIW
jgi:hypothetical protein